MTGEPRPPIPVATVALVGLTCLGYELLQVRMLAFFLGNSMDFLAIPIALLGLAIGSLYNQFLHRGPAEVLVARLRWVALPLLAATFFVFFFVADTWFSEIHAGLASPRADAVRLAAYSAIFLPPYVVFGAILSALFGAHADRIGRLYFVDLAGAALGCVLTPLLLTFVDLWAAIAGVLAGGLGLWAVQARRRPVLLGAGTAGFLLLSVLTARGSVLREHPDANALAKYIRSDVPQARVREIDARWNAIARTSLLRLRPRGQPKGGDQYRIVQDNGLSNVWLTPWRPGEDRTLLLAGGPMHGIPWILGQEPRRILVMFAGAGRDMILFDTLAQGRADITGVELNPLVVEMSHRPQLRHLGLQAFQDLPRIHLVIEEGRDFLHHDDGVYDHIYVANNGAVFANRTGHSRKFLDTREAMAAYLDHLAPGGTIVFNAQSIAEKVTSFHRLFGERGLGDVRRSVIAFGPTRHPEVDNLVVKPGGFTDDQVAALTGFVEGRKPETTLLWAPGAQPSVRRIAEGMEDPASVRRVTDDRPFVQGLALSQLEWIPSEEHLRDHRYVSSWVKAFGVLLFTITAGIVAIGARVLGGVDARVPGRWIAYLVASGIGFMAIEIGLIAKTELFVGNPLYAVAVNLAVFLVATSVGALLQDRVVRHPGTLLAGTVLAVLWSLLAVGLCDRYLLSLPLPVKALAVLASTFPAGVALGSFYPYAVGRIVRAGRGRCVPMTYTLATASSVLGSVLAMTAIIDLGFTAVIGLGAVLYGVAGGIACLDRAVSRG
jgi:hypothetical protein